MSDMQRLCDLCHDRPAAMGYREITGWEKLREQGGANHITARRETGRLACMGCIERMKKGLSIEQAGLF